MPACALQLGWPQTSDEQSGAMRCRAWLPLLGTQWPLWPKVCAASQLPELHKAGYLARAAESKTHCLRNNTITHSQLSQAHVLNHLLRYLHWALIA